MIRSANYKEPEDVFAFNVLTNAHNHGSVWIELNFSETENIVAK